MHIAQPHLTQKFQFYFHVLFTTLPKSPFLETGRVLAVMKLKSDGCLHPRGGALVHHFVTANMVFINNSFMASRGDIG